MEQMQESQIKEKVGEKEIAKKVDLYTFLDRFNLTRAERSYYEKHYKERNNEPRSVGSWEKIIKFVHQ